MYLFHSQDQGAFWSVKLIYVKIQAKAENLEHKLGICGSRRSEDCISSEEASGLHLTCKPTETILAVQ